MGFKDEVSAFLEEIIVFQSNDNIEHISDEDAIVAINILNYIQYNKVPDIFLGCSAYNLLSAYSRQKERKLGFQFRRHIYNILKGIEDVHQPKAIKIAWDNTDYLNLLLISFWNFQFSFQSQRFNDQLKRLLSKEKILWDGIRKQKCAQTIFNFAFTNDWISNLTMAGANLREFVEDEREDYLEGKYSFEDGRIIKDENLKPANADLDIYLKNYIRQKLYSCQDRPVIISGIFRRIWDKHITFTSIKPFIPNTRVITICDHINLFRPDVEKVMNIRTLVEGQRYYIIGYCKPYKYDDRMGIQLAIDKNFLPIFPINEFQNMPIDIKSECHRFSIEEYLSQKQKRLKL